MFALPLLVMYGLAVLKLAVINYSARLSPKFAHTVLCNTGIDGCPEVQKIGIALIFVKDNKKNSRKQSLAYILLNIISFASTN